jgi:hypothetical protein
MSQVDEHGRKLSKNGKPLGRPRKTELQAKKKPGKVGRPKGDAAIMNDYKAAMLARPSSEKVIEKMYNIALDDDHKHQAIAMKMIVDRVLPVKAFEQDVTKGAGKSGINITISTVGDVAVSGSDSGDSDSDGAIDGEWTSVESTED